MQVDVGVCVHEDICSKRTYRWTCEQNVCKQASAQIRCMKMIIREGQQGEYRRNEVGGGLCVEDDERGRWKLSKWDNYISRIRV